MGFILKLVRRLACLLGIHSPMMELGVVGKHNHQVSWNEAQWECQWCHKKVGDVGWTYE